MRYAMLYAALAVSTGGIYHSDRLGSRLSGRSVGREKNSFCFWGETRDWSFDTVMAIDKCVANHGMDTANDRVNLLVNARRCS